MEAWFIETPRNTQRYSVTSQKPWIFINTAVIALNLSIFTMFRRNLVLPSSKRRRLIWNVRTYFPDLIGRQKRRNKLPFTLREQSFRKYSDQYKLMALGEYGTIQKCTFFFMFAIPKCLPHIQIYKQWCISQTQQNFIMFISVRATCFDSYRIIFRPF